MFKKQYKTLSGILLLLIGVSLFSFYPPIKKAQAATFTFKTGTYVGDGTDNRTITGLGFQPDLVIIKDDDASGADGLIMKTSSMAGEVSVPLAEAEADLATNNIQSLDSDGFTIGTDTDVNTANIMYHYIAFGGSDCSSTGTFCVGTYTGTGAAQNITTVGFQPNLVFVKRSGASQGVWRSSSMGANNSNYFSALAQVTARITGFLANGFSIGNNNEVSQNGNTFYYVAFTEVNDFLDVGTYTGNNTDGRDINSTVDANLDFQPDFVWVKNTGANAGVGSIREHYGDRSFIGTDGTSAANNIQILLSTGGFDIGNSASVNSNGVAHFYFAFGGANNHNPDSTGTYAMAQGTYTGTGAAFSITGVPFAPDLVIIKGNTAQYGVFRTKLMTGDRTAYLANAASVFTGAITALNTDGFSVGTSAVTNTNAVAYDWVAYGNASRIDKAGGAADFIIGQYIGTGNDSTDVIDLGVEPDVLVVKRVGATAGAWRTPDQAGDNTLFFTATAAGTDRIQALNADGFQKGTQAEVNTSGNYYDFFAFTVGSRLTTGTYTGSGASANRTGPGFQPDFLWIKKVTGGTGREGVMRTSERAGDTAYPFINTAAITNAVTNLILNGFSVNTAVQTNENTFSYQFVAWNAKEYTQQAYRWFTNADSTDVAAALAAANTAATISPAAPLRLRMLLRNDIGNLFADAEEFDLQVASKSGTCDTAFSGETYADVSGSTEITFFNNPTPAHDAALTANANDPTDGGRTITNQTYNEQNPALPGVSSTLDGQTAKFDFALDASNASPGDYCLRLVFGDGTLLENYTQIPEITVPQEISYSLSDNSIGFGNLSSSATRWATGDTNGSGTSVTAHTLTASTNADNGYSVLISGSTLNANGGTDTITAIGGTAVAPATGSEQFGLRLTDVGTGAVSAPYNTANYAFDTAAFPDTVATGAGDNSDTTYDMIYIANITGTTDAGSYQTVITYTVVPNY